MYCKADGRTSFSQSNEGFGSDKSTAERPTKRIPPPDNVRLKVGLLVALVGDPSVIVGFFFVCETVILCGRNEWRARVRNEIIE
jgi:hypothetical protein